MRSDITGVYLPHITAQPNGSLLYVAVATAVNQYMVHVALLGLSGEGHNGLPLDGLPETRPRGGPGRPTPTTGCSAGVMRYRTSRAPFSEHSNWTSRDSGAYHTQLEGDHEVLRGSRLG